LLKLIEFFKGDVVRENEEDSYDNDEIVGATSKSRNKVAMKGASAP
jgi:hypothetical protein